jgi:hypothetical protein
VPRQKSWTSNINFSFSIHINVASLRARSLKCRELIANQPTDEMALKCIRKLANTGWGTGTNETGLGLRIVVSKGFHKLLRGQTFGALCQVEIVLPKQQYKSNVPLSSKAVVIFSILAPLSARWLNSSPKVRGSQSLKL